MSGMSYWKILTRRKSLHTSNTDNNDTKLGRVLNTFDLTALGVGATLGVGVYVLAGHVSRDLAGPAVILSFLIAAIASFLAGLCYAEFGSRVPKAGSAYIYSYVCIGEFVAFITGWNLILQYVIGSASISRGLSLYLDTLLNDTLKNTFRDIAPMKSSYFSSYFDFVALGFPILLAIALAFGLKKSAITNNIFTAVNVSIVLFVIIAGAFKADISNWQINPANIVGDYNVGEGGFFPFGIEGMLKGAATCFFGFVGFDCIATTGEEVRNPKRAIPKAIIFSLFIIFLSYFGISTVLTLMWPYYLQDINAPLPFAFSQIGWDVAKWIVAIGGIVGLITSLFGAMFPLPRIIYAMSMDGLVFKFLGRVNVTFKTPIMGTMCAGLVTGLIAALFDLKQLVNMLSIGTLLAYTVVAISITILRFSVQKNQIYTETALETSNLVKPEKRITCGSFFMQIFNFKRLTKPTKLTSTVVATLIFCYSLLSLTMGLLIMYSKKNLAVGELWAIIIWSIVFAGLVLLVLAISMQPRETTNSRFIVPLVPLLPGISIFVNIYLMLMLDSYTWIFFGIWLFIGLIIYFVCTFWLYNEKTTLVVDTNSTDTSFKKQRKIIIVKTSPETNHKKSENGRTIGTNGSMEQNQQITTISLIPEKELQEESDVDLDDDSSRQMEIGNSQDQVNNWRTIDDIVPIPLVSERIEENKQKTSASPPLDMKRSASLDEIVLVSEVVTTHVEKKEPNGTTYFIEERKTPSPTEDINKIVLSPLPENEATALAILDDVIKKEDYSPVEERKSSISSRSSQHLANSTVAVVHQVDDNNNDDNSNDVNQEDKSDNDSGIEVPLQHSTLSINMDGFEISTEPTSLQNNSIISEDDENKPSKIFMEKLNELIGLQTYPSIAKRGLLKQEDRANDSTEEGRASIKSSKSDSDLKSLLLQEIKARQPVESEDHPLTIIPIDDKSLESHENFEEPPIDYKQENTPTPGNSPQLSYKAEESSNIPTPPKFDPVLYRTASMYQEPTHHIPRARLKSIPTMKLDMETPTKDKFENEEKVAPPEKQKKEIDDDKIDPNAENEEENDNRKDVHKKNNFATIKNKLEEIYRHGPPLPFFRPRKQSAANTASNELNTTTIDTENDQKSDETEENVSNFKGASKPFDTVHKQKVLFSDVLKAINPDTKPSIIRNESIKKNVEQSKN